MFLAGVVLAPLAQFDDLGAGQRLLGFERVGRQFDLRAVGAELGDDPGMPGFAGHRELEIIDARQASAAIGILDETDAFERHGTVKQLDIELAQCCLTRASARSRRPWLCQTQAAPVASSIKTKMFPRVSIP